MITDIGLILLAIGLALMLPGLILVFIAAIKEIRRDD